MKNAYFPLLAGLVAVGAVPVHRASELAAREVPQEHSHQQFLTTVTNSLRANNPNNIGDAVFGLLGNQAAAGGLGKLKDPDCLQQETADQAFTNAKAAKDVAGMSAALIYRALERNSGTVGAKSNACTSAKAVNPEIAAIQQHQDPASAGAAAGNKAVTLALAKQLAAVGGNPQDALKSGTFKPGSTADKSGKGNTCDDANDATGCIFTQNLLVPDATADEINAAVGGQGGQAAGGQAAGGQAANGQAANGQAANNGNAAGNNNNNGAQNANAATPAASGNGGCQAGNQAAGAASASATPASSATPATPASGNGNAAAGGAGSATLNLGAAQCSDPAIAFGVGFDGRKEASFEPDDKATFQHGSAQNAGIIAQFICDRLQDQCKAPAATVSACRAAQAKVNGQKTASAADTFNAALGVKATKVGVDEKA